MEPPNNMEFTTTMRAPNHGSVKATAKIADLGMASLVLKMEHDL